MGGHGGLNILPQKKWNVYNWDNRIKVKQNQNLVQEEKDKRLKAKNSKIFQDKINSIKNGSKYNHEYLDINKNNDEDNDNKIYLDIMKKKNLEKITENDLHFENRLDPKQIELLEEIPLKSSNIRSLNKIKNEYNDNINEKYSEITFKDSIKNNLKPWYININKNKNENNNNYKNDNDTICDINNYNKRNFFLKELENEDYKVYDPEDFYKLLNMEKSKIDNINSNNKYDNNDKSNNREKNDDISILKKKKKRDNEKYSSSSHNNKSIDFLNEILKERFHGNEISISKNDKDKDKDKKKKKHKKEKKHKKDKKKNKI
jgi:hypothetical protein